MTEPEVCWPPPVVKLEDFRGDVQKFIEHLYGIFQRDLLDSRVFFNEKPVIFSSSLMDGKSESFHHITTASDKKGLKKNEFDLERGGRVPWIKPVLENCTKKEGITTWKNKRGNEVRTSIYYEEERFHIILTERKNVYIFITCYFVSWPLRHDNLIKEKFEYQKAPF